MIFVYPVARIKRIQVEVKVKEKKEEDVEGWNAIRDLRIKHFYHFRISAFP
jgi:hypothetical protein